MEARKRMSEAEVQELLQENSRRYCAGSTELSRRAPEPDTKVLAIRRFYNKSQISASRSGVDIEDSEEADRQAAKAGKTYFMGLNL